MLTVAALLVAPGLAAWTPWAAAAAAVEAHVAAIEAVGSIEPKNARDALAQVDFDSLYGRIRFSGEWPNPASANRDPNSRRSSRGDLRGSADQPFALPGSTLGQSLVSG
jgi:hypothetical protein